MTNDLQQFAELLLKNRISSTDWGEISHLEGRECSKIVANTFVICCLLDFQWDADVAWRKGEELADRLGKRGDPEDVWVTISSFTKEAWDAKYEEFGRQQRYRRVYRRMWRIANDICAWYDGDARNIWSGRSPFDACSSLGVRSGRPNIPDDRRCVARLRPNQRRLGRREGGPSSPPGTRSRSLRRGDQRSRRNQGD